MPRENKTKYALLGMLTYGPMSGYDMKKMSDHSIGHFWNENFGAIYPMLRKMEAEGFVTMSKQQGEGAPDKKVYSLTEPGREEFAKWLKRKAEPTKLREELLLQMFFGHQIGPRAIIAKLQDEIQRCDAAIAELEELRAHLESFEKDDGNDEGGREEMPEQVRQRKSEGVPYWLGTVTVGLGYYSNLRDSSKTVIEQLKALRNTEGEEEGK